MGSVRGRTFPALLPPPVGSSAVAAGTGWAPQDLGCSTCQADSLTDFHNLAISLATGTHWLARSARDGSLVAGDWHPRRQLPRATVHHDVGELEAGLRRSQEALDQR
jgi:hypothetical protein